MRGHYGELRYFCLEDCLNMIGRISYELLYLTVVLVVFHLVCRSFDHRFCFGVRRHDEKHNGVYVQEVRVSSGICKNHWNY